jgi:hypothetical protein
MTLTKQQKEAVERGEAVSMTVDGTECVPLGGIGANSAGE